MIVKGHIGDNAPGLIGTTTAGSFTVMGFIADAVPIFQVLSLICGIAVAVITFVYYWRKVKKDD